MTVYTRGTKTVRIKTSRLLPGTVVLTQDQPARRAGHVWAAQTKTGAVLREVEKLEAIRTAPTGFYGRAGRVYTVYFTDGTRSEGNAPVYTWHGIDDDESQREPTPDQEAAWDAREDDARGDALN